MVAIAFLALHFKYPFCWRVYLCYSIRFTAYSSISRVDLGSTFRVLSLSSEGGVGTLPVLTRPPLNELSHVTLGALEMRNGMERWDERGQRPMDDSD